MMTIAVRDASSRRRDYVSGTSPLKKATVAIGRSA
jgi:hypothetical protein